MTIRETRRILPDGVVTEVQRVSAWLQAPDGRRIDPDGATHLPPVTPTSDHHLLF